MEHEKKERSSFTAASVSCWRAAGSAVGLGNLWRFPYLAAQYGGGIFILVYIILALTFGFTLMATEIAIGRKTKQSPGLAYKTLHKKFGFLGTLSTLVADHHPALLLRNRRLGDQIYGNLLRPATDWQRRPIIISAVLPGISYLPWFISPFTWR